MAKDFVSNLIIRTKDQTTSVVGRVGKSFKSLGGIVTGVAATLATAFSVRSITRFLTGATQEAGAFQEQIAKIGAVSGATGDQLTKLQETALRLGSTTAFSATEAAQGMEALARAGLNAEETISTIPAVLALAQGNSLELGQSAEIITRAVAGMGLAIEESGRVADVLAAGAANANTNVEGLAQALSFAAPSANALGLEVEETVALIGKLADAGIDASRAGSTLNNVFSQFKDPASSFRAELRQIGITTEDFSEALRQLEQSGTAGEKAILSIGLNAGPGLRALLSQGTGALDELSEKLRNSEGAAQNAADAIDATLPGALRGLKSAWESLRLSLGEALIEPVTRQVGLLADKIREFVNSDSIERLKDVLVQGFEAGTQAVKDFLAQFGTVDEATNRLVAGLQAISSQFGKLSAAASAAGNGIKAVFEAVNTVVSGLATGVSAAATVLVGVVNGLVQALASIGLASESVAMKSQIALETLQDMNVELAQRTVQAAKDSASAFVAVGTAIGQMAENTGEGAAAANDLSGALEQSGKNAESAAEKVARLDAEVMALEEEIDGLIAAGADMETINEKFGELGEVISELESAEAGEELRELTTEVKETGTAAADTAVQIEDMRKVLQRGRDGVVDIGGELRKLRAEFEEGKLSATDYASRVDGLGQSLQDLTVSQISKQMADLDRQFRSGQITAGELAIGIDILRQELRRQADAARAAREENDQLTGTNRQLAGSYRDVADAAGDASNELAKRSGRRLVDPSQINDLEALVRLLKQANDTITTTFVQGGDNAAIKIAADYRDAIQARIDELKKQNAEDRQRRVETRAAPEPVRAPLASASAPQVTIQIDGVLDINDRASLESLARKLQPILTDIERRYT